MRESRTEFTLTCDRCKKKAVFDSESREDMEQMAKWQSLNTSMLFFLGQSFDLCPECFGSFKKEFLDWLPPAFKEAFEN